MSVKLGDKVKDAITGFTGIVVSRTEFLYGCVRCAVQPTELKDGKCIEPEYFDEQRLGVSEAKVGGPGDCAKPPSCPKS